MEGPGAFLDGQYRAMQSGGAEWNLEPGPEPSRGWITLPTGEAQELSFDKSGHILTFIDHRGKSVNVSPLYIEAMEEAGPGLTTVALVDIRYFWHYVKITKQYNILNDDGTSYHSKTTYNSTSTRPWTFEEIVKDIATKLSTGLPSGFPRLTLKINQALLTAIDSTSAPVITNLSFENVPAGEALAGILQNIGATVSVSLQGDLVIAMPGEDLWSSKENATDEILISKTEPNKSVAAFHKPKTLELKYRILREKRFDNRSWEPVMQHDGYGANGARIDSVEPGEWMAVDDVLKDWGLSETQVRNDYFDLMSQKNKAENKNKAAKIAAIRAQFYKAFRYNPSTSSTESRQQILPLIDEHGTSGDDMSGEAQRITTWSNVSETFVSKEMGEGEFLMKAVAPATSVRVVNEEQGIIQFNTQWPICKYEARGNLGYLTTDYKLGEPNQIQVVVAFYKKFQSSTGLEEDYYTPSDGYSDSWTGLPDNGCTETLIDDSVDYVETDHDNSGSYTALNDTEVDARAGAYAEDFFKGFEAALGGKCADVAVGGYIDSINRLCGKLHFMQISANTNGYSTVYRVGFTTPINPMSANYYRDFGGQAIQGDTVQTSGPGIRWRRGSGGKGARGGSPTGQFQGLRAKGDSPDYRSTFRFEQEWPDWINPQRKGLGCAEDFSHTAGGGDMDRRTKWARITKADDGRPEYTYVKKFDQTPNRGNDTWEAVITTPDAEKKTGKSEQPKSADGYSRHSNPSLPGSPGAMVIIPRSSTSGGGGGPSDITRSNPAQKQPGENKGQQGTESTHIWLKSPEGIKTKKGPLRNVLMVDQHRVIGTDPDGHTICVAAIDKGAMVHKNDNECGPLLDIGTRVQPPPDGIEICVEQIYSREKQGWVYMGWAPIYSPNVPTPEPTPGPPPTPQPPPVTTPSPSPGGGGPVPTGGPGVPADQPPVLTPSPGGASHRPVGDGVVAGGWNLGVPWGNVPEPGWFPDGGMVTADQQPPGRAGGDEDGDEPEGADEDYHVGPSVFDWAVGPGTNEDLDTGFDYNQQSHGNSGEYWRFTPAPETRTQYMPSTMWGQYGTMTRALHSRLMSPYFPGTCVDPGAQYAPRRMSSYFPGSPGIHPADEDTYALDDVATSFDWDSTTMADERPTPEEFANQNLGQAVVDMQNQLNNVHARVETLDERSRADYNYRQDLTLPNADQSVGANTTHPHTSRPTITASWESDGYQAGMSIDVGAQNPDGTWPFTVYASASPAATGVGGDVTVMADIKGACADTTDIDP